MKKAKGDCYQSAGSYFMENYHESEDGSIILVHATVRGEGPLSDMAIGHAWIERIYPGGIVVVDNSNDSDLTVPADLYRRDRVIDEHRYSHSDLCKWTLLTEHWGPWEGRFSETDRAAAPLEEVLGESYDE